MSKYVKNLLIDDVQQEAGRRQRRAAGQRRAAWTPIKNQSLRAKLREQEHPA